MSSFSSNAFVTATTKTAGILSVSPNDQVAYSPGGVQLQVPDSRWGSSNYTEVGVSSNRYANGSNQNCGNVMTGRSSTRLHAPPGGSSSQAGSLIFGGGYTNPNEARRQAKQKTKHPMQPVTTHIQNVPVVKDTTSASKSQQQTSANNPMIFSQCDKMSLRVQAVVFFKQVCYCSNQNCGNFITDRPTTRVHALPGGKSSGPLW